MTCSACGALNPAEHSFCSRCGNGLHQSDEVTAHGLDNDAGRLSFFCASIRYYATVLRQVCVGPVSVRRLCDGQLYGAQTGSARYGCGKYRGHKLSTA